MARTADAGGDETSPPAPEVGCIFHLDEVLLCIRCGPDGEGFVGVVRRWDGSRNSG